MTTPLAETSPVTRGRILAALYLLVVIAGITAQSFIADRLVVRDDAARTAANILANMSLYRLGFTIFMLEMIAQVGVSTLFYDLMKPVDKSVARVALVIGLTGCGIKTMARLFYYTPLILLGGASYLAALQPAQLASLFLWPPLGSQAFIGVALFAIAGVIAMSGWLFIRGVDDVQWRACAALAATSIWR
jgi:hypothetical protein